MEREKVERLGQSGMCFPRCLASPGPGPGFSSRVYTTFVSPVFFDTTSKTVANCLPNPCPLSVPFARKRFSVLGFPFGAFFFSHILSRCGR